MTQHECRDYWETTGNIRVHHTCKHTRNHTHDTRQDNQK